MRPVSQDLLIIIVTIIMTRDDNNHSNDNKEYLYCALFHGTFGLYIVTFYVQNYNTAIMETI